MTNKASHKYGRGTFVASPEYVDYMRMIVEHENYRGMPGAVSADGRISWQVSSGKSTSFYKFYVARAQWWIAKADALSLPGSGKSQDRFSITARLIHPTGSRPCRLCGQSRDVGYMYLSKTGAKRLSAYARANTMAAGQHITSAIEEMAQALSADELLQVLKKEFPERAQALARLGPTGTTFLSQHHLRSSLLSPGFMCNPPDRLDGFHDYCLACRGSKDPGRSIANLKSYSHDRRAFEWWAEGDWQVADALFNQSGSPGICVLCGEYADRVSPDHIGPLACGFKHIPLFQPSHGTCNSSKNRRLSAADVYALTTYERKVGESVASWQVRPLWDALKVTVKSDEAAAELSSALRNVQDHYLRMLERLKQHGRARFLSTLLSPDNAYFSIEFEGLDRATLTFKSYKRIATRSSGRASLAARSVRIAFESLAAYASKERNERKLRSDLEVLWNSHEPSIISLSQSLPVTQLDERWQVAVSSKLPADDSETAISALLDEKPGLEERRTDSLLRAQISELFEAVPKLLDGNG